MIVKHSVRNAPKGRIIITMDGPAGAGKSTLSRMLASELDFLMLDSGAIYRTMAMALILKGVSIDVSGIPQETLGQIRINVRPNKTSMKIFLNDVQIGEEIRSEEIGIAASSFATLPEVRSSLLDVQRSIAMDWNLVAEGRDMGIVVFPDAFIKFFVTAELEERANRRYKELLGRGESPDFDVVMSEMRARDSRDMSRKAAPLAPAPDSILIDTTNLTQQAAILQMIDLVERRYSILGNH